MELVELLVTSYEAAETLRALPKNFQRQNTFWVHAADKAHYDIERLSMYAHS